MKELIELTLHIQTTVAKQLPGIEDRRSELLWPQYEIGRVALKLPFAYQGAHTIISTAYTRGPYAFLNEHLAIEDVIAHARSIRARINNIDKFTPHCPICGNCGKGAIKETGHMLQDEYICTDCDAYGTRMTFFFSEGD